MQDAAAATQQAMQLQIITQQQNNDAAETNDAAVADTTAAESEAAESVADTQTTEGGTITVAASATPHAEILEEAKKILADQGWDLEITILMITYFRMRL